MTELCPPYGGVLLCGGKGSRLEPVNREGIPKSLFKVGGRELMRYSLDALPQSIVQRLVFAVDYKAEEIRSWVLRQGLPHTLQFSEQSEPGVLAAIQSGAAMVQEDHMVTCNTDEIRTRLNMAEVVNFHQHMGRLATMVVCPSNRLYRHRLIEVREHDQLVTHSTLKPIEYKNDPDAVGLVNTGLLLVDRRALEYVDPGHSRDWSGLIDPLCEMGQLGAFVSESMRYYNVGTPEELQDAETSLAKLGPSGQIYTS